MSARSAGRAAEHSRSRRLIAPGGDDAVRIEHAADAVEEKIMRAACRWQRVHRLDAQTVGIVPERDQGAQERVMTPKFDTYDTQVLDS